MQSSPELDDVAQFKVKHPYIDGRPKGLLIDGKWEAASSGRTFTSINPSTGASLAELAHGDVEDVDRAVQAAQRAFHGPWRKLKPFDRQEILLRIADLVDRHFEELAILDSLDFGGPITRTLAGRRRAVGMLRYYAGLATAIHGETIENSIPGDVLSYVRKEPIGVVGAIIPWNAPLGNAIWKLGPVLATGCTVVMKPSEEASLGPLRLGELMMEAGVPPGVVNIVTGPGNVGAALAAHPMVDKVAFTGSTATGQSIVRASAGNLKRLSLELGGKSPDIVFADANLVEAVPGAAMAAFANAGQICSAGTRLYVEQAIYDEFVEQVAEFGRKVRLGNSLDPKTEMGPLVSARQLERVCGYFDAARREGARAVSGGNQLLDGNLALGFFVPPTVFADVDDEMSIATEEIFGPVIAAIPFTDIDDVLERSNKTRFGLGAGVWTRDISKAHRVAKSIQAGTVWVNCYQLMDPAIPFGGYKMSGYGRESGRHHIEEYLNSKAVIIRSL
jgi:aldehyde dehydrogenase (NAD+)